MLEPVTHVLTTRLELDSSGYGWPLVYTEWQAFRQLVVDICCETFCIVLVRVLGFECE